MRPLLKRTQNSILIWGLEDGSGTQGLGALATLSEVPGSIPSMHTRSHKLWFVITVPEHPPPSSGLHRYQAHMWYTNRQAKTLIH